METREPLEEGEGGFFGLSSPASEAPTVTIASCGEERIVPWSNGLTLSQALRTAKALGLTHIRGSRPTIDGKKVEANKVLKPWQKVVFTPQRELKRREAPADGHGEEKPGPEQPPDGLISHWYGY